MQSAPKHRKPFSGRQELTLGGASFNISGTGTPVILPGGAQTQSSAGLPRVCVCSVGQSPESGQSGHHMTLTPGGFRDEHASKLVR